MNAFTPQNLANSSSADGGIPERLRYFPAAARWEMFKHYWRGRANSGWSGFWDAYVDWAGSKGARWKSREKNRENANAAALRSAETRLALLKDLISDRSLYGATRQSIREIVSAIERPEVTLVFGGHFKAGKSSILNAIIGRSLLPSGRLPETGAMCAIRSGTEESATVKRAGQVMAVECSTEMIRSVCSIVDRATGGTRDLSDIVRIEITLQRACIPNDIVWIDSPGITDDRAMDECARRAAAEADVLVWVLWTKHPVGEPEAAFLRRHLNEKGAASVVFLLNCFLAQDREDIWKEYANQDVPRIWRKLEEVIGPLGFCDDVPLVMLPISARAIREVDENAFGGPDLRELLGQFDSPRHPRVQRTRWHRASMAFDGLALEQERPLKSVRKQNVKLIAELQRGKTEARRAKVALLQIVNGHLREFLLGWSLAAREAGRELADGLNIWNLWNNAGKHGPELARRINQIGSVHYYNLRQAIEDQLLLRGFQSVTTLKIDKTLEPLLSHSLESDVPKAELNLEAWAKFGGAAGIAFLAVQPLGIAMMFCGSAAALRSANKQLERIRQSIPAAVEKFVLELEKKIDQVAQRVTARFSHCVDFESHAVPDRRTEKRLEVLSTILRTAAEEARKVSDSFII